MSAIHNFIHGPVGSVLGFHSDKMSQEVDAASFLQTYTFQNITNVASWIPGVSMIVGVGRIIGSIYDLCTREDLAADEKLETKVQIGRGVVELIPVGFFLVMIGDIAASVLRATHPYLTAS